MTKGRVVFFGVTALLVGTLAYVVWTFAQGSGKHDSAPLHAGKYDHVPLNERLIHTIPKDKRDDFKGEDAKDLQKLDQLTYRDRLLVPTTFFNPDFLNVTLWPNPSKTRTQLIMVYDNQPNPYIDNKMEDLEYGRIIVDNFPNNGYKPYSKHTKTLTIAGKPIEVHWELEEPNEEHLEHRIYTAQFTHQGLNYSVTINELYLHSDKKKGEREFFHILRSFKPLPPNR
ncbi:hypothetical protein [Marinithermofilum abyssi]|uniref:hypothetical protein n=1 Tax=Marinithermofilum abyssi TaxID=1571185 RepID=UPI00166A700B|nr:hypothetical protein [Marinithermofilum abyssi]